MVDRNRLHGCEVGGEYQLLDFLLSPPETDTYAPGVTVVELRKLSQMVR
jgi:hypothetical protein